MLLIEKVQELQAIQPPLDPTEIKRRIEEWKSQTGYKAPEAVEVKTKDSPGTTDSIEESKNNTGSEALDSGNGQSLYQDDYGLSISPIQGLTNKTGGFGTPEFNSNVIYNMQLEEYERKKAEHDKAKKEFESKKQAQQEGIDIIEGGEALYDTRVIIPRGEIGFDEFTFNQVQAKIDNKEPGFENVKDVKDYVSKVPGAQIVSYTKDQDRIFEGAITAEPQVDLFEKYNPAELNPILGNSVWGVDQYNIEDIIYGLNEYTNNTEDTSIAYDLNLTPDQYAENLDQGYNTTLYGRIQNNELNPADSRTNLAIDFTGSSKVEGVDYINIQSLHQQRIQLLANKAFSRATSGDLEKDFNTVIDYGKNLLTPKELDFTKLSKEQQDKVAADENYGEVLYFGDNLNNLDLDNIPQEDIELFNQSNELAETTELEVLKDALVRDYYKVVGLAQEIVEYDKPDSRPTRWDGLNNAAVASNVSTMNDEVISQMKKIATTGEIPSDAEALTGSNPLIQSYNEALKNFKIVNRAVQLNRDPLTVERGWGGQEFVAGIKDVFGVSREGTDQENKEGFLRWSEANNLKLNPKLQKKDILYTNFGQDFGTGLPHLMEWTFDTALFGRASGGFATKASKFTNTLINKSAKIAKNPYTKKVLLASSKASASATNFAGGTLVNQLRTGQDIDLDAIRSSYNFGLALGYGHPLYDGVVKYIKGGWAGRFLAKSTNDYTKLAQYRTPVSIVRDVGAGFSGAITYQFGGVLTTGSFEEVSLKTTALETAKMTTLNWLMRGVPGAQMYLKNAKSDLIKIRNSGRLELESKKGAEKLGVKIPVVKLETDTTTEAPEGLRAPQENALNELESAFENKVNDLLKRKREGKISKEEADKEFKDLKDAYRAVDTQIAVNSALDIMKSEQAAGNAPKESEFYLVSQKIKNGEKLNARDGEVLSYYGLDGVNMLYKHLGIQKNSTNDRILQTTILNESVIDAQLKGKSFLLTPYGLTPLDPTEFVVPKNLKKLRTNTREFLLEKQRLNSKVYELENLNKEKLSESEKLQNAEDLKNTKKELEKYIPGGELYENIQSQITTAATKAYEKDIQQVDPSAGTVIEARTPEEFQKIYNESGFKAEDVKDKIAFTDKDGNKVINREFALQQRNFTPVTHEIPHSILKDSFKDAEGNVTPEGIEMIDGVLSKLTPRQKQVLDQELASRYDVGESKEKWYEENITVLAELIKRGEIQFSKSFGEGLAGLVPAFKNFLPNIEVNPNTGKGIFDMLKAQDLGRVTIEKSEGKEKLVSEGELAPAFSLAKKETVLQSISNLVPKEIKTKKEFDTWAQSERGGKIIADALKPGGAISNYIKSRGTKEESDRMLDDVLFRIYNFNPEAKRKDGSVVGPEAFGEKIFADTAWAKVTARTKLFEEGEKAKLETRQDDTTKQLVDEGKKEEAVKTDDLAKKPTEKTKFNEDLLTTEFKQENGTSKEAIENKITKTITEAYKGRDITGFKDLGSPKFPIPRSVAKLYADMFGIKTVDGLTKKAQNFYPRDRDGLRNLQKFLIENSLYDYNRLPNTVSDIGKATGIKQTKLGKIMYNDNGVKVGTIKQYRDIIQGKNITLTVQNGTQKGESIEFNKRVKDISRGDLQQNLKTAWDFHAKNRALETLVPEQGKRIQAGAKFSQAKIKGAKQKSGVQRLDETAIKEVLESVRGDKNKKREILVDVLGGFFPNSIFRSVNFTMGNKVASLAKRGFDMITNVEKISDPKLRKEAQDLINEGVILELESIRQEAKANEPAFTEQQRLEIQEALTSKAGKDFKLRLSKIDLHNKGVDLLIDQELKIAKTSEEAFAVLRDFMYHYSLNANMNRNQATNAGTETGAIVFENGKARRRSEVTDEHVFPAIEHANAKLQIYRNIINAEKSGDKQKIADANNSLKRYKEWIKDNYWQIALKNESDVVKGNLIDAEGNVWTDSGGTSHPVLMEALNKAIKSGKNEDWNKVPSSLLRYFNGFKNKNGSSASLNPNNLEVFGKNVAVDFNVEVAKNLRQDPNVVTKQGELINKVILTEAGILTGENAVTRNKARKLLDEYLKVDPKKVEVQAEKNNDMLGSLKNETNSSKDANVVITELKTADQALNNARSLNIKNGKVLEPVKRKIRIFDFDDTLARSNSKVIVEMPDGKSFKINATQFAKRAAELESKGADFDFTEFSKVVEGKKGPLFEVAKKIADARGTEDLFVLTARPADAAGPIKEFLKALGIDIPLKNITGLADGKASAKGRWVMGKVAEGYNDFYFADDALKNVQAVKEVLDQADVKGKVQQAKFSKAKTFNTITNEMIEASSGIESFKTFSAAKAKTLGENKGRFDWLTMASSAEDFKGLLYKMIGKGKQGEAHFKFLKTNLIDPYNRAEDSAIQAKISAANDFMALKSMYKTIPTTLKKQTGVGKFTYQHALRTYMWTKQGMSIPGLSKADIRKLNKFVIDSPELQTFADQLIVSQKGKMYPEPGKNWLAGNLTTDIIGGINKVNRAEYQKTFRENVDIIFSPENLNKMEAAYGTRWRKALEDTLRRMKSGSNRPIGGSEITNKVLDWTNNSVGAVMFLNTRSALLQTISAVNFLNWGDNNPIAAGKAFANQKQFWGDFMTLMNSDYLVQRRKGLKINVSESEIADAVKDSKNKVNAAISYLLSKGFVFTRYADSFAIASGGATFYRNRIKKYVKEGMDQKLAEQKAFNDFKDVAEESQQSSDASKISMQQASGAGRIILNWANTPMQYVRIQKRAAQDLINGRGDWKTNVSKIAYYGAIQNLIFNSLQQALFAIGFGSDEDEDDPKIKARNEQKIIRVANGMVDSQLKGLGIAGAAMVATKNTIMKIIDESERKRPEYEKAAIEALSFSPAISSKYRKVVGGLKSFSWNMKEIKAKGFSLDNPAYLAGSQIFTAFTNIPLDRVVKKVNNIRGILSEQTAEWQKIALSAGYSTYDVGLPYYGGWDAKADPTPEELKQIEFDKLKKDTKTADQVEMLLELGLTKKQIKALRYEEARVKKIIELQNKKKDAR